MKASTRVSRKLISSATFVALSLLLGSQVSAQLQAKKEGIQTLVLVDDWSLLESHSLFFDNLRKDGHAISFESANPPPNIKYYESYFYDNIILMAPSVKGRNSHA